jgi:hypothetical protein
MPKRRSKEGVQSNTLEQMGLEHDTPTPDFSDQPDSGGRIGGIRGRQEFGIEGGVAGTLESEVTGDAALSGNTVEDMEAASAGFPELFGESEPEQPDEEEEEQEDLQEPAPGERPRSYVEGDDLRTLIEDRLIQHPSLHLHGLHVSVRATGLVTVGGRVRSEAEKLRVTEVLSALPGVQGLRNLLTIG